MASHILVFVALNILSQINHVFAWDHNKLRRFSYRSFIKSLLDLVIMWAYCEDNFLNVQVVSRT